MVDRFLLIFVDGVGLAPESASNPLATAAMPSIHRLLGGPMTIERAGSAAAGRGLRDDVLLVALDAALGVSGLPQSATGQTTLFTGVNAAALLGRHVAAFPGPRLAAVLAERSLLRIAAERGRRVTFANPFTAEYFEQVAAGSRRHSATTLAALASGTRLRDLDDLVAGRAVAFDVRRDAFRALAPGLEPIAAREAGAHLAAIAAEHDLTLWETFVTDLAGHRRRGWTADEALARVDGLLGGLLAARPPELTVLLSSDHGNLEDATSTSHTPNPVPLLVVGPRAGAFAALSRLDQVAPRLLELMDP